MTNDEKLVLCAKDMIVTQFKWQILHWTSEAWWNAVQRALDSIVIDDDGNIRAL